MDSFLLVLRHRSLILSLVFLFSLGGILNAVGHCLLDYDFPTKSHGQISVSISCLDNQDHPFLAQVDQRGKGNYFSKAEKRTADVHPKALYPGETFHFARPRAAVSTLVSLSVPIYQFKNVFRI
jgi:hypothetical protein